MSESNVIKSNRYEYLDRMKGAAIFLVVFGHLLQFNTQNYAQFRLFNCIYAFHMPLFFFLSGYAAVLSSGCGFFDGVKRKTIALVLPMVMWPVAWEFFLSDADDYFRISSLLLAQFAAPSLWFLKDLYLIFLLYYALIFVGKYAFGRHQVLKYAQSAAVFICILIVAYAVFGKQSLLSFVLNLSFFAVGFVVSKSEKIKIAITDPYVALGGALFFCLFVGQYEFSKASEILMKLLKVVLSLSSIIVFYNVALHIRLPVKLDCWLRYAGRVSLVVYVTHFPFARGALYPIPALHGMNVFMQILILASMSTLVIALCMGIGRVVNSIPLLDLLLYGRKQKAGIVKSQGDA